MRQTLFYLPTEIAGYPLFGTGILFWAILLAGLFAVVRRLVTKGGQGDAIFYACITALGLFLVRCVGPHIAESNGFPIRGYGVFLTLALILSTILTLKRGKKLWNYPAEIILSIVFVAAFCGIIGARLFYVAQYWRDLQGSTVRETLLNAIDLTSGGLVVYGSILGGMIAVVVFLLWKRLPVMGTLDLFAPSLALGVAIGRIGCLMNGCCFGGVCDLPWAISFPVGSPAYTQQVSEGVVSLYGLTLAPQINDQKGDEKTLFTIKSKHVVLPSETPGPVVIASVDQGSAAEEAGITPGSRICEMGLAPKGFLDQSGQLDLKAHKIRRFRPESNAQAFYFFLNMWNASSEDDVWLVLQTPDDEANDSLNIKNVVFHPEPTPAKPVHPTQIYSSINAFIICVVLILISRVVKRDGIVFAWLLLLYPVNRFCLELIRTDEESFCGTGLTVSQCVSVLLFVVGVGVLIYNMKRPPKRALATFFSAAKVDERKEEASNVKERV